jgi:hypothetical protein
MILPLGGWAARNKIKTMKNHKQFALCRAKCEEPFGLYR